VLVTPSSLAEVYGVAPWQYRDYAALRGDPSDNLHGVRGFGAATSARLLAAFGTLDAAWAALDRGEHDQVRAAVGESAARQLHAPQMRDIAARNRQLMTMYTDVPVPDLDQTRLPLDLTRMRQVLAGWGITLGPSLWALTGGAAPAGAEAVVVPQPWVWRRSSWRARVPGPGQLALF
jgi:DNA polymerase-1